MKNIQKIMVAFAIVSFAAQRSMHGALSRSLQQTAHAAKNGLFGRMPAARKISFAGLKKFLWGPDNVVQEPSQSSVNDFYDLPDDHKKSRGYYDLNGFPDNKTPLKSTISSAIRNVEDLEKIKSFFYSSDDPELRKYALKVAQETHGYLSSNIGSYPVGDLIDKTQKVIDWLQQKV